LEQIAKQWITEIYPNHRDGLFIRINPLKPAGKTDKDVTAFRHVLVEFDLDSRGNRIPKELQYGALLESGFPISAILDSGDKSIHGWVRVDAPDRKEYDRRREIVWDYFKRWNLDPQNKNPSRYSRCPSVERNLYDKKGNLVGIGRQTLLAINVGPVSFEEWEKENETIEELDPEQPLPEEADEEKEERPPFPIEALPDPFGSMAWAVSQSLNVPIELTGPAMLGALSTSIHKNLQIQTGPDRLTPCLLHILAFALSGTGKTESARLIFEPIFTMQNGMAGQWTKTDKYRVLSQILDIEDDIKDLTKEIAKLKKAKANRTDIDILIFERADKLKEIDSLRTQSFPRLWSEDATAERIASLLAENNEKLTLFSEDASKPIQNILGRYNPAKRPDDNIIVKSYSMAPCSVDRERDRSEHRDPISLEQPAINVVWFTQPDKIPWIFGNETLMEGGFVPRCDPVDTKTEPMKLTGQEPAIPSKLKAEYKKAIHDLMRAFRLSDDVTIVTPSAETTDFFRTKWNEIAEERKRGLHDINSFAARWIENAWRIAGLIHGALHGTKAASHELNLQTAFDAWTIQEWFSREQLRLLKAGRFDVIENKVDSLIKEVCRRGVNRRITVRALKRGRWNSTKEIRQLVAASEKRLRLSRKNPGRRGGRPSYVVSVR
jgi:hypothetical protein